MTAAAVELRTSAHGVVLRRAGRSLLTIVIAVVVLGVLWTVLLRLFGVSSFVGKSPSDVWQYLFSDAPQLWYLALVSGLISGLGYLAVGVVARIMAPWTTGADTPVGVR